MHPNMKPGSACPGSLLYWWLTLQTMDSKERLKNKLMSIREIETAITQLPTDELVELVTWLEGYYAKVWDQQIEQDLEVGHLDALLAELDEEYGAGLAQPL